MSDDEPIDPAVLSVATVAEHVLVLARSLAPIHGPQAVRDGLAVALVTFAERTGGPGMVDELRAKIETLLANPAIMDAVIKWLH